jgi:hypothetical protein
LRVAWLCNATTMKYNPDIYHRRSNRLKHYDYSRNGAYFVTLCTFDRGCYLIDSLNYETSWMVNGT